VVTDDVTNEPGRRRRRRRREVYSQEEQEESFFQADAVECVQEEQEEDEEEEEEEEGLFKANTEFLTWSYSICREYRCICSLLSRWMILRRRRGGGGAAEEVCAEEVGCVQEKEEEEVVCEEDVWYEGEEDCLLTAYNKWQKVAEHNALSGTGVTPPWALVAQYAVASTMEEVWYEEEDVLLAGNGWLGGGVNVLSSWEKRGKKQDIAYTCSLLHTGPPVPRGVLPDRALCAYLSGIRYRQSIKPPPPTGNFRSFPIATHLVLLLPPRYSSIEG